MICVENKATYILTVFRLDAIILMLLRYELKGVKFEIRYISSWQFKRRVNRKWIEVYR